MSGKILLVDDEQEIADLIEVLHFVKRNPNFFRQESPIIKPFSEKFGFYISLDLWECV